MDSRSNEIPEEAVNNEETRNIVNNNDIPGQATNREETPTCSNINQNKDEVPEKATNEEGSSTAGDIENNPHILYVNVAKIEELESTIDLKTDVALPTNFNDQKFADDSDKKIAISSRIVIKEIEAPIVPKIEVPCNDFLETNNIALQQAYQEERLREKTIKMEFIHEAELEVKIIYPGSETEYGAKSQLNPKLIDPILNHPMTSKWSRGSYKPYTLHTVLEGTPEFNSVKSKFSATARGRNIIKIDRVENPYLLGIYLLKKDKMQRDNILVDVTEKSLFHGTRIENIDSICKYNFDWRRHGQSRGHKFGKGVSFTPQVSYARHYTHGDDVMFLAKVLVAHAAFGNFSTTIPPRPYDTTQNHDGNVIVKYDDDDFYPEYIIYYDDYVVIDSIHFHNTI